MQRKKYKGTKRDKRRYVTDKREYYRAIYLKSDHWKQLRLKKLAKNPNCEKCNKSGRVDVHHKEYRNLYDVTIDDLQTLCREHHDEIHKETGIPRKHKRRRKFPRKWKTSFNRERGVQRCAKRLRLNPCLMMWVLWAIVRGEKHERNG